MADEKKLIPIVGLDQSGIIKDSPAHILPPNAFSDGKNVRFKDGAIKKRKGTVKALADVGNTSLSVTAANRGSGVDTATFTFDSDFPGPVGSTFTISGVVASGADPTDFNGTHTVQAVSDDFRTVTIEEDISTIADTGTYSSGGTCSFTNEIDFFDFWPAPAHPQYIEVYKSSASDPAVPLYFSTPQTGTRNRINFEQFNVEGITKANPAVITVDGYLYLAEDDTLQVFSANDASFDGNYTVASISYDDSTDKTTITCDESSLGFSNTYIADSGYAVPKAAVKPITYPANVDLKFQSTLFQGGYAYILNDGYHTPQYALASLGATYSAPTFRDLPGWDWQKSTNNTHIGCKVVRGYQNVLIAGNLKEYAITSGNVAAYPSKTYPGTIRISTVAAAGSIPETWEPGTTTAFADEFELSTTSEVQDILPLQGTAIIYTTDSIHSLRFDARGLPSVQTVAEGHGCLNTGLVLEYDGKHFVIGSDDIYLFGGHPGSIQSVANSKMRDYFFDNLNPLEANRENTFIIRDQSLDEIQIYFPNKMSTDGTCNEFIAWNYRNNTWSVNDCDSLISGVYGPVRGGGVAGGDIVFAGVANTSDTASAEKQTMTVALTSNYPTTGVNEVQEIDYSAHSSAVASEYDAENVIVKVDSDIIPYNEEVEQVVFNNSFASDDTNTVSLSGQTSTITSLNGSDIDIIVDRDIHDNSTTSQNTALRNASSIHNSGTGATGSFYSSVDNTSARGLANQPADINPERDGWVYAGVRTNFASSNDSSLAFPTGDAFANTSGNARVVYISSEISSVLNDAATGYGTIKGYRVGSTWYSSGWLTNVLNSLAYNTTSEFVVRLYFEGTSGPSDISDIDEVAVEWNDKNDATRKAIYYFRPGSGASSKQTAKYRYYHAGDPNNKFDNPSTTTYLHSSQRAQFVVESYRMKITLQGKTSNDSITITPNAARFPDTSVPTLTANGSIEVYNNDTQTFSVSGSTNTDTVTTGTHNGSSIGTIASDIAGYSNLDFASVSANLGARTQSATITATSRGNATSYQSTSSGYGFFSNSEETGNLEDEIEEFGFRLPGSDFPEGEYVIEHGATFGASGSQFYSHDGTSDFVYRYDKIQFNNIPTTVTVRGSSSSNLKDFVRTVSRGSSSSTISFTSNSRTIYSRRYSATLGGVTGVEYRITNSDSSRAITDVTLVVGPFIKTADISANSNISVTHYTTSSKNYTIALGDKRTNFSLTGSGAFPDQNDILFPTGYNASEAAQFLADYLTYNTDYKLRAAVKGSSGADARTVRIYYTNDTSSSVSMTFTGTDNSIGTNADTGSYTISTLNNHRSLYSSWRVQINDTLGNEVIDETYTATSSYLTPTQIGEFLRDEIIADVNASGVLAVGEDWIDNGSGLDAEGNYIINIYVPSDENYTVSISDATSPANNSVSGFRNTLFFGSLLSADSGDTPDSIILRNPANQVLLTFNLLSGETIDSVMTRIKDKIQDDATDGYTASIDTSTDTLTITSTQPGTVEAPAGGATDDTHTDSGVFKFEYTKGTTVNTEGNLPSSLEAEITTLGSNESVELTLYDPWRDYEDTFLAGGSDNTDIAEAIAVRINNSWPNWNASFSGAVATIEAKEKDWVLSDRTGVSSNDVTFASRAIYVKEVAYPAGTVGATGNAATGTFTASSQSSNFTAAQSVIGHPVINKSVLTLTVNYSDGRNVSETITLDNGAVSTTMATNVNDTINGASVESLEASVSGSTVTVSITDYTVGVDSITFEFDEQTESGNRNTVSRTNGNNLGTAGVTQTEPTATTSSLNTKTDADRPYPTDKFNLSLHYPLLANKTKVFAQGFGYTRGADPTADPVVAGTAYTSYVERQQLPIDGSVEYKKDISYVQLLLSKGNVGVKIKGLDAPGATADFSSIDSKVFNYASDYKIDYRENGRVVSYRIEDETPGISKTAWEIAGIGFKADQAESRGKR